MSGVDSSILVYAMDPTTHEHMRARDAILKPEGWAVNPTVVHEVYHSLVFKRKMTARDASSKINAFVRDRRTRFLNITRAISVYSIDLAVRFNMGGRDSLIVGCYMHNGVERLLTHDRELLRLGRIDFKGEEIAFTDPIV